jgi:hypothetical protein
MPAGETQAFVFHYDGDKANDGQRGYLTRISGPRYEKKIVHNPDGTLKSSEWRLVDWLSLTKNYQYYANKAVRSEETLIKKMGGTAAVVEKTVQEFLQDKVGRSSGLRINGKNLYTLLYDTEGEIKEARFENRV